MWLDDSRDRALKGRKKNDTKNSGLSEEDQLKDGCMGGRGLTATNLNWKRHLMPRGSLF